MFCGRCFKRYVKYPRILQEVLTSYDIFFGIVVCYFNIYFSFFQFQQTKVIDVSGKTFSRGSDRGLAYAKFKARKFLYLNITSIGSDYVMKGSECGLACVNTPSCFSFNLASLQDVIGKMLCELLSSDMFNNSDKLVPSQRHHHFSIMVSSKSQYSKQQFSKLRLTLDKLIFSALLFKTPAIDGKNFPCSFSN